jgi:hypothetical protein
MQQTYTVGTSSVGFVGVSCFGFEGAIGAVVFDVDAGVISLSSNAALSLLHIRLNHFFSFLSAGCVVVGSIDWLMED